jgi:hypothetical protein
MSFSRAWTPEFPSASTPRPRDGRPGTASAAAGPEPWERKSPPEDLLDEGRWSAFALASAARGVRSSLSLPILREERLVGGINVYAAEPRGFRGKHDGLAAASGARAQQVKGLNDIDVTRPRSWR